MGKLLLITFIFSEVCAAIFTISCRRRIIENQPQEEIITEIKSLCKDSAVIGGYDMYHAEMIDNLYNKNGYLLSARWSNRKNIEQLFAFIQSVHLEGLNPEEYNLISIENQIDKINHYSYSSLEDIYQLELLLKDAFLTLSEHMAYGKTDQKSIDPQWEAVKRNNDIKLDKYPDSILLTNKVTESLHRLTPSHREYVNLKKALVRYRYIEKKGGWKPFYTDIKKIEKGMLHPDIGLLRQRLSITQGPIRTDSSDNNLYDQSLYEQVVIFQLRNGLTCDGAIGKQTVEALNIPVDQRIASIKANLERWRWLSEELGEKYIMINIANFDLKLFENGKQVFSTEVIVGRPYRKTPVFSSSMKYIVLNPDWTIPPTILNNDVIPAVIDNKNYLTEKRMKIISRDGKEVDPATIDWHKTTQKDFPYMIRQSSGAYNSLGRIKFMFPNQHNVYIHDTPARNLFTQTQRTFSSGCIRVNKPFELANLILKETPGWSIEKIKQMTDKGETRTIHLAKPIPVHLLYLTAWADEDGIVYFRKDIYNRDQALLKALD